VLVAVTLGASAASLTWALAQTKPQDRRSVARTAVGTVKAVSSDSVVVIGTVRGRATEWTFAVDARTRITQGGEDVTSTALAAGDRVHVRYTEHAGRTIAQGITVARRELDKRP
jgi:hypothetical protein